MRHNLYTVRDKVAELCAPVFQAVNHGVACRSVVNMLEQVAEHDRDAYELLFVGSWDDVSMKFEINDLPERLEVAIPRFGDIGQRDFNLSGGKN